MVFNPLLHERLSESLVDLPSLRGSVPTKKPQLQQHSSELSSLSNQLQRVSIMPISRRHAAVNRRLNPVADNIRRRESLFKATLSRSSLQHEQIVGGRESHANDVHLSRTGRESFVPEEIPQLRRRRSTFITEYSRHATRRKDPTSFKSSRRGRGPKNQESFDSLPDKLPDVNSSDSPRGGRRQLKRQRTFPSLAHMVKKVSLINMLGRNNGNQNQGHHKKLTAFQKEHIKRKVEQKVPNQLLFFHNDVSSIRNTPVCVSVMTCDRHNALHRFRRAGRMVQLLLRAVHDIKSNYALRRKKRVDEVAETVALALPGTTDTSSAGTMLKNRSGLTFNPADYKPRTKGQLSQDVKKILSKSPGNRTPDEIRMAQMSLQSAVEAFAEFPSNMQESLAKVAWYESFEPNRVIIRQGHRSETYYFILSGTAVVTVSSSEYGITGDPGIKHVAFLKKGNSFGEIALMHHAKRAATVVCKDTVELLAIDREDFINIFMHRSPSGRPNFLRFLHTIPEFSDWPIHLLPDNEPTICLFTFFRPGVVICKDSNQSDWIYVIKSGSCRVLKKLAAPTELFEARSALLDVFELTDGQNAGALKIPSVSPHGGEYGHQRNMTYPKGGKFKHDKSLYGPVKLPKINDSQLKHRPPLRKVESKLQMDLPNGPITPKSSDHTGDEKTVYLQIQQLTTKDTFGFQSLLFRDEDVNTSSPSVTLVSDGAECVMLSKRFFLQHLTTSHRSTLVTTIRPYPSEESLHQKLQQQTTWEQYKCITMQKAIHKHSKAMEAREHHSSKE